MEIRQPKDNNLKKGRRPSLAEIFAPRGVAVVGVSATDESSFARRVVLGLQEAGFPTIYPVNPKYTDMMGLRCYPSLQSIPGVVDHVVVCIPATATLALLDDCAAKGVRSVHFFTAGFSETNEKKQIELEKGMLRKAIEGGFRIIGPNCIGLYVAKSHLTTVIKVSPALGTISFISQSGGYAEDLPYLGRPRGLRFSKIVSYGNALDVDESELLEFLSQDPDTEIICAYIEGVKDGKRFFHALKKAASQKPVIIYKGGTTESGQKATRSHTASMTSSTAVFNALCHQANAIQVDELEELIDMLVILQFARPLPQGTGVAVVGAGGGPSVLASDEMEKSGLRLTFLPPEVQTELKRYLPSAGGGFDNPVDATNLVSPKAVQAALCVVGAISDIHVLIYHLGFHPLSRWGDGRLSSPAFLRDFIASLMRAQQVVGKPVILVLRPPPDLAGMKDFLTVQEALVEKGFPVLNSLRQAGRSLARVIAWYQTSH